MDKNGDHMAVDPVSPAANFKEKELFDQQPTALRRNSIDDQDPSRPRKRLATMGSTTPHSQSPPTDKEDLGSMELSTKNVVQSTATTTAAIPSSTLSTATAQLQVMEQPPDTPSQTLTAVDSAGEEEEADGIALSASESPSTVTINARPSCPSTADSERNDEPESPEQPTSTEDDPEKAPSPSPSGTSGLQSPWQERPGRSLEVEVEELESMEEDDSLTTESVTVVGPDPDRRADRMEALSEVSRGLQSSPFPRLELSKLTRFIAKFLDGLADGEDQLEAIISQWDIWTHMPKVIACFLERREPLSAEFVLGRDQEGRRLAANLLIVILRLTAKFTELEARNLLERAHSYNLGFVSGIYQRVSADILSGNEPLFIHLQKDYDIRLDMDITAALPAFVDDWDILRTLKSYIQALYLHVTDKSKILVCSHNPLTLLQELIQQWLQRDWAALTTEENRPLIISLTPRVCEAALDLFKLTESTTKKCLESHPQATNIKDYSYVVDILGMLVANINVYAPEYGLKMFSLRVEENLRTLNPHERGEYSQALFKLPMFTSLIRCNRMDARLMGITKLTEALLRIWKNLSGEANPSVALRYLADDVRRSGIIEYLVGPESHPELIRLSYNIGSFLVVNRCLTPDIRDAIWQPLIDDNKDHRIVQAVMKMIMEFTTHMHYTSMVDFCRRAIRIPFSSYDSHMLDFVGNLLAITSRRFCDESRVEDINKRPRLDSAPYHLIIGLIRKVAIAEEEGRTCKGVTPSTISDQMARDLVNFTQYGPPTDVRREFFLDCIADIKSKTASTTGSIIVLGALLQRRPRTAGDISPEIVNEIETLTGELGLVDALIEDIAAFVDSHHNRDAVLRTRKLKARLDLLYWILLYTPDCMVPAQIERICEYLIGDKSLGYQERDMAFNNFSLLANPHPFIDFLFEKVYPKLNPSYISLHCLEACKRWVEFLNKIPAEISKENTIIVQGIEQIWRVILRSPDRNLGIEAIHFLIRVYLESPLVIQNTPDMVHATHRSLVERCIQQLTLCSTALRNFDRSTEDNEQSMALDIPESEIKEKQLEFDRSILLLNELLKGYRSKPRFLSNTQVNGNSLTRQVKGTPLTIRLTWYDRGTQAPVTQLHLGSLDTAEDLHQQITTVISSANYRAILSGRELHLKGDTKQTLGELNFNVSSHLMVQKRPGDSEQPFQGTSKKGLNTIETEVLKHFDELYELLDSRESQALMIWNLLNLFPVQPKIRELLLSDDPPQDILPSGSPFRTLYLLNGMSICLEDQTEEKKSEYITRMVKRLVRFLMKPDTAINASNELRLRVINDAMLTLMKFLKSSVETDSLKGCFDDEGEFVSRIVSIWEPCLQPENMRFDISGQVASNAFSILLEAASFKNTIWEIFIKNAECVRAIERMLLQDPRPPVRIAVGQAIVASYGSSARHGLLTRISVAKFCWSVVVKLIPQTYLYEDKCVEFFELANMLFEYLGANAEIDTSSLQEYFQSWTSALGTHKVKQVVGRTSEDQVVIGYAQLLWTCITLLRKNYGCNDLPLRVEEIFKNLLFTPFTQPEDDSKTPIEERVPCLGPLTRENVYRLLLRLAEHSEVNEKILALLTELVPEDENILPDSHWNFDRTQLPISSAGRVGLRNLSNTCYLNSLLTQLFMNIPFRSFILGMTVDDPDDTQNLLQAMKILFAKMQNGLTKSADTRDLASAIKDYENNEIDVTVQMDVDEFFNLLFDRLESQMESAEQKNAFRAYYGGKLVQQVKSKECPHISEREEPFSAIQCDIKGKHNLQESLKAYVEGEIMEGDNKYSCTSCNKHVDAVKRACLKEIPDHLIFHLKRFEFDLHTMVRSKINDTFEFPECIDMRPYTIQYLSDNPCTTPDIFQLTGVLVHNGTAESGHYYSYIKDRNEYTERNTPAWFEFNDAEVSPFEPSTIPTSCYGGTDFISPSKELGQPIAFHKSYSAYMLFYERVKPLDAGGQKAEPAKKVPIPQELANEIVQENERAIRRYCLFDGPYLFFTASIFRQAHALRVDNGTPQSECLEQKALRLALRTYEQIGSRIKDSKEGDDLFEAIKKFATSPTSLDCARTVLRWICENPESLRLLLLRCFHPRIRENFAGLILGALSQLRRKGDDYFLRLDNLSEGDQIGGILPEVLNCILSLWDNLTNIIKAWDEYFMVLNGIASFGPLEKELLLRHSVLRRAFTLFMLEYLDRETKSFYPNLLKVLEKNPKRISYRVLLELIENLLGAIDFNQEPCKTEEFRIMGPESTRFPLTFYERNCLLHFTYKDKIKVNTFIFKQVSCNCNIPVTQRIIRMILDLEMDQYIFDELVTPLKASLMYGIVLDPANEAGPYLQALIAYCVFVPNASDVKEIINRVAEEVWTIHMQGGREHLDFFKILWYSKNMKMKSQAFLPNRVLETVHLWAPPLLCYWETPIRLETEQLLKEKLFHTRNEGTDAKRRMVESVIEKLPDACFRFVEEKFFKNKEISQAADEKSFDSLIRILELCPRMDVEEDPGYSSRIDGLRNSLIRIVEEYELGSENWAASDVGSDSNHELCDDDSV